MPRKCEIILRNFPDDGTIPNNPVLPVIVIRGALRRDLGAGAVGDLHRANGWFGNWVFTVFDYHHWHPDAHEVLSVVAGWAELMLGGPSGEIFSVVAGDTVLLPAGTGHCRLAASAEFTVCGAYPPGQENYTTQRSMSPRRAEEAARIAEVALPVTDPLFGASGPVLEAWSPAPERPAASSDASAPTPSETRRKLGTR